MRATRYIRADRRNSPSDYDGVGRNSVKDPHRLLRRNLKTPRISQSVVRLFIWTVVEDSPMRTGIIPFLPRRNRETWLLETWQKTTPCVNGIRPDKRPKCEDWAASKAHDWALINGTLRWVQKKSRKLQNFVLFLDGDCGVTWLMTTAQGLTPRFAAWSAHRWCLWGPKVGS